MLFGLLSTLAGFLSLFLPETHQRDLPETIADAEKFDGVLSPSPTGGEAPIDGDLVDVGAEPTVAVLVHDVDDDDDASGGQRKGSRCHRRNRSRDDKGVVAAVSLVDGGGSGDGAVPLTAFDDVDVCDVEFHVA